MAKAETKKAETKKAEAGATAEEEGPQFAIQRIYVKDLSFESPSAPKIFLKEWQPELHMDVGTKTEAIDDDTHEVILTVTITVKVDGKTAFLVEVKQAGIFTIKDFPEDQVAPVLGSFCPNVLYPYARQVVTDAVVQGGFPQLYLAPVNFDALYQQHLQKQADKGDDKK